MKKTRILSTILAMLMLVGPLASCATGDGNTDESNTNDSSAVTEEDTELQDELPDNLDYGNDEIILISRDIGMNLADEIYAEGLNSDPVNDAIYERNKSVENRLGVKITSIRDTDTIVDKVITTVNGGSADYDVMVEYCWLAAPKTIEGYFADLRATQYIDFEKPWWTQSFNDVVSYHDHQYGITGAMVLSTYRRTYTTVFNKRIFTDANQPYLYDHVENGTWTLDKQAALVPLLHRDNGNGVQDEEGDVYGFVSNDFISVDPYWAACEIDILSKNEDGDYVWVFDSGVMHNAAEKILNLYFNTDGGTFCFPEDDSFQTMTRTMFSESYAAMATLCIHALENSALRNMTDEYGVVPIPKYDEKQTEYHSQMHDAFTIACIPTTVKGERLEEMAAFLEAMSSASYRLVRPDYYETTLRTKIAQDPQSAEMMDLIINGIHIDAGIIYSHNIGSFHQGIQALVEGKTNNAVSRFKSMSKSAQNHLIKLVKKLDTLADQ